MDTGVKKKKSFTSAETPPLTSYTGLKIYFSDDSPENTDFYWPNIDKSFPLRGKIAGMKKF